MHRRHRQITRDSSDAATSFYRVACAITAFVAPLAATAQEGSAEDLGVMSGFFFAVMLFMPLWNDSVSLDETCLALAAQMP
jgi:hypothetical protein